MLTVAVFFDRLLAMMRLDDVSWHPRKRVCRPKGSSQSRTNRSMKTAFPRQIGLRQSGLGSAVNRPSGLKLIALTQGVTAVVTEK
jgi:hypothetical protein